MRDKKGDFEFSFAWIFAIIAGVIILFLAIYMVTKSTDFQRNKLSPESSMEIGVLTNPLESSFESSRREIISTNLENRIYLECDNSTQLGRQNIRTAQKIRDEWGEGSITPVSFQNKYMFSKNPVEGRTFYVFSKPLDLPFKIADLIYITSTNDKYCFIDTPKDIEDEIKDLRGKEISGYENLFLKNRTNICPVGSINVCFKVASKCDVSVSRSLNYVEKDKKRMYYIGDALMYAAIFSNKDEYECQLDRLIGRTENIVELYKDKSAFILKETGCNSELEVELMQYSTLLKGYENSEDLNVLYTLSEEIYNKNEYADCKLW